MKTLPQLFEKGAVRVALAVLTTAVSMLYAIVYFRHLYLKDALLGLSGASNYLGGITIQSIIANLPIIMAFTILLLCVKQPAKKFFLKLEGMRPTVILFALAFLYICSMVRQLVVYDDTSTIIFRWFYYLVFVAFIEEFEFRALIPWILGDRVNKYTQWILPNVLFAVAHCTIPIATGQSALAVFNSLASGALGYILSGIAWEWCKRKTNTLWIGVLIHALMDFGV